MTGLCDRSPALGSCREPCEAGVVRAPVCRGVRCRRRAVQGQRHGGEGRHRQPERSLASGGFVSCPALPVGGARALLGFTSTLVALAGFYAALTAVLAGQLGGGGHLAELVVEVGANRIYFLGGIVTGPILGAVGAWIGRYQPNSLWLVVGALVATEILVVALVHGHQLSPAPFYFNWGVADWTPYVGESIVGVAVVLAALWRKRSRAT